MDRKGMLCGKKSFKDEEKSISGEIQFHSQSPRFKNSALSHSETMSTGNNNSQNSEFNVFQYSGEKMFFSKFAAKLEESRFVEGGVSRLLEKVFKRVQEEDFSIQSLLKTISSIGQKGGLTDQLKVKSNATCQSLVGGVLPLFSRALAKRSLEELHDLLRITMMYEYENFNGIEKSLTAFIILLTKMLQIPKETTKSKDEKSKQEEEYDPVNAISDHVQRLVLLNVQNLCGESGISLKLQTEMQLIFKRIWELIMHFLNFPLSSAFQSGYSFLRFLATLLRTGNSILMDLRENKQFVSDSNNSKLSEKVFQRIFKFIFLGNPTFHVQIFGTSLPRSNRVLRDVSSSLCSSLSEYSENDEGNSSRNNSNRGDIIEAKIRLNTCSLLTTIIRVFPSILQSQWQTLVKSHSFTKEFILSLREYSPPQFNNEILTFEREHAVLYPNYMETSCLSSLVFEENIKVKIAVIGLLNSLVENLPSKLLLLGLDLQKCERNTSTFQPQSYLMYCGFKNIHFTLLHLFQTSLVSLDSSDENTLLLYNQCLKLYLTLLTHTPQFDKMNFYDGIHLIISHALLKPLTTHKSSIFSSSNHNHVPSQHDSPNGTPLTSSCSVSCGSIELLHLKLSALSILNAIAKSAVRFPPFASLYLHPSLNNEQQLCLFELCLEHIRYRPSIQTEMPSKEDTLRELIALESIALLINLQKHYFDCLLLNEVSQNSVTSNDKQHIFPIWDVICEVINDLEGREGSTAQKRTILMYDLLENIAQQTNKALAIIQQYNKEETEDTERKKEIVLSPSEECPEEDALHSYQRKDEIFSDILKSDKQLMKNVLLFDSDYLCDFLMNKMRSLLEKSSDGEESNQLKICGLSLSVHIRNEQWVSHPLIMHFYKENIFSLQASSSSVLFQLCKTLGSITFCQVFTSNPSDNQRILQQLLQLDPSKPSKRQPANLSVSAKQAQSLANWCSNIQDYSHLSEKLKQTLLSTILEFAASSKDKVSSHGLRAVGIFLQKNQMTNNDKQLALTIRNLLSRSISSNNPKVVWNACVALANIFSRDSPTLLSDSIELLTPSLEKVLLSSSNSKSQLYALKALQSIISHYFSLNYSTPNKNESPPFFLSRLLSSLADIASDTFSFQNTHTSGQSLGESAVAFLMSILVILQDNALHSVLIEFIRDKYYHTLTALSHYIYQLWKHHQLPLQASKQEQTFQDKETDIFNLKTKLPIPLNQIDPSANSFEELLVKGQEEYMIVLFDLQHLTNNHHLKQQLQLIKRVATIIQQTIDKYDELSVSLVIYEHIKAYSLIDLQASHIQFTLL